MPQGTVAWFNSKKGFGFITYEDGIDIFVHKSGVDYIGVRNHLEKGLRVTYEENEEAVKWLVKAAENGLPCYPLFNRDPNLESLKGHSGFDAFMRELRKKWEYYKTL